jgi:hypothetical protein
MEDGTSASPSANGWCGSGAFGAGRLAPPGSRMNKHPKDENIRKMKTSENPEAKTMAA